MLDQADIQCWTIDLLTSTLAAASVDAFHLIIQTSPLIFWQSPHVVQLSPHVPYTLPHALIASPHAPPLSVSIALLQQDQEVRISGESWMSWRMSMDKILLLEIQGHTLVSFVHPLPVRIMGSYQSEEALHSPLYSPQDSETQKQLHAEPHPIIK